VGRRRMGGGPGPPCRRPRLRGGCDLQGLMRPGSRTIKHLQGFFTNNNATGNILWCDWDGFHTD
jgi:hypothetical protein